MAEGVVEDFEMIQIDQQQRHRTASLAAGCRRLAQSLQQLPPG